MSNVAAFSTNSALSELFLCMGYIYSIFKNRPYSFAHLLAYLSASKTIGKP